MFFEIFDNFFFFFDKYGRVAAAHYGEARAHARPARRGARSTPRGYAPLESSGNGCLQRTLLSILKTSRGGAPGGWGECTTIVYWDRPNIII